MKPPAKRGRKRGHNPHIPSHIDQTKLPDSVYFDHRGRGAWYTLSTDETGRRRRSNVATHRATLADLHQIMQERKNTGHHTLRWLCQQFHASAQFKRLAAKTRKSYEYSFSVLEKTTTRLGMPFADLERMKITAPVVQRLVDSLADKGTPATANHVAAYLRRVYRWGINRGHCQSNPATTVEAAQERKRRRLPEKLTLSRITFFCQERGQGSSTEAGAVAPFMWPLIEIAYLCRLRAIEVITLTDANALEEGILTNRRKGSRDNVVRWSPRLRAAWDAAVAVRNARWEKRSRAVPLSAEHRPLFVAQGGDALTRYGLDSAWFRMMKAAVESGTITAEEKFGLHDLKRRGITDTQGNRHDKQEASGHRSERMLDIYDLSLPVVPPSSS